MALLDRKRKKAEEEVGKQMTNEEQMAVRQSSPQPTAMDYVSQQQQKMLERQGYNGDGVLNGFNAVSQPIGKEQIQEALQTLRKYKEGKANLEKKIIENEQWYKVRHWECMRDKEQEVQPASAWLLNCILNKHADALDNYPSPNILPREEGDKKEATTLSSIIPVVLEMNEFEKTYSDVWYYKLKTGTGVYGVFWDKSKLNGLGDISIKKIDLLNLFWESGITDIQESRNLFSVELVDNDLLEQTYPKLSGKLGSSTIEVAKYIYDDSVDTTNKSAVIDWYYHKYQNGRKVLHYCKFVDNEVLFSTENDANFAERGFYDHGLYPFVFDVLYPVEGTPTGFGYIDIGKDAQAYIDRGNQAILENMLQHARPRYFVRNDGSVNLEDFADLTKPFVKVDGNLGQDSIIPMNTATMSSLDVSVINNKIDELKETTGNRDVSTGGAPSGITAASALAALQESSSKLSRDNSKAAYRSYRQLILMVIELIRQFYDLPRQFRIVGEDGTEMFMSYSNAGIAPQAQGVDFGVDMGVRIPQFDIEVTAQKQSPYSKMSQNELALQFYNAGFFNPQMADQAMACLDMMDFDRKQFVMQKVQQNGLMYQQMMQMQQQMLALAQMVDHYRGGDETTQGLLNQFGMEGQPVPNGEVDTESIGGEDEEASITKKARQRVAESTSPT